MAKRKHHGKPPEEHMDETWLVPYSDILTLLLALFIVLFASAQVDQKKFDQIRMSFSNTFGSGSPAVLDSYRIAPETPDVKPPDSSQDSFTESGEEAAMRETVQLSEVKKKIDRYIDENNLTGDLQTALTEDGLMVRIKDTALFPSGSAELLPESQRLAAVVAKMLVPLQQKVTISGHTDNVPINTREFPSNWELSSQRAVNFMKFILAQEKSLQPERFSATGYGEFRPIMANDTAEGKAKNRRVEVLIVRNYRK
ncbi:MAG: flagellar motor protein MotB [Veillonellales bacterium]